MSTSPLTTALQNAASALPGARIVAIIGAYAELTGTRVEDLAGSSQTAEISRHRHDLMYLIRNLDKSATYAEIGAHLGGRHWSSVHEAIQKVELSAIKWGDRAARLFYLADQIEDRLQGSSAPLVGQMDWQITAAASVLRDDALTDTEARKAALTFLQQLEGSHA